mgnify:CR=1 FL=1
MRASLIAVTAALALAATGASFAGDHRPFPQGAGWFPSETIRQDLQTMGYQVDRVKFEHDAYEIRAVNDSGVPIKATYDARTGEMTRAKLR